MKQLNKFKITNNQQSTREKKNEIKILRRQFCQIVVAVWDKETETRKEKCVKICSKQL